jgi:hypothetical protein
MVRFIRRRYFDLYLDITGIIQKIGILLFISRLPFNKGGKN